MVQLKGFRDPSKPDHVHKLWKELCGLKQALQAWFEKLKMALVQWGSTTQIHIYLYLFRKDVADIVLVLVYMDDICFMAIIDISLRNSSLLCIDNSLSKILVTYTTSGEKKSLGQYLPFTYVILDISKTGCPGSIWTTAKNISLHQACVTNSLDMKARPFQMLLCIEV